MTTGAEMRRLLAEMRARAEEMEEDPADLPRMTAAPAVLRLRRRRVERLEKDPQRPLFGRR